MRSLEDVSGKLGREVPWAAQHVLWTRRRSACGVGMQLGEGVGVGSASEAVRLTLPRVTRASLRWHACASGWASSVAVATVSPLLLLSLLLLTWLLLSLFLLLCLCVCESVCLPACMSVCPSVCMPVYLCT